MNRSNGSFLVDVATGEVYKDALKQDPQSLSQLYMGQKLRILFLYGDG